MYTFDTLADRSAFTIPDPERSLFNGGVCAGFRPHPYCTMIVASLPRTRHSYYHLSLTRMVSSGLLFLSECIWTFLGTLSYRTLVLHLLGLQSLLDSIPR